MRELDHALNQLAQGRRPMAEGLAWFEDLSEDRQRETLEALGLWCWQAHPTRDEALESIRASGLRPTHTPAVLVAKDRIEQRVMQIAGLRPRDERVKAFRLLVHLLGIADARRREACRDYFGGAPCPHEWHNLPATPPGPGPD